MGGLHRGRREPDAADTAGEIAKEGGPKDLEAAGKSPSGEREAGPTHVVTVFLLRQDRGFDETLLARRSGRVRTYQGRWGAISGYIEPGITPLQQAYQEIHEETSLEPVGVRLLKEGEPLAFRDEGIGKDWVVHPFLFAALQPDAARHDWEAVEFRWTRPSEVAGLPTVPMLAEALARVYSLETGHDVSSAGDFDETSGS